MLRDANSLLVRRRWFWGVLTKEKPFPFRVGEEPFSTRAVTSLRREAPQTQNCSILDSVVLVRGIPDEDRFNYRSGVLRIARLILLRKYDSRDGPRYGKHGRRNTERGETRR